MSSYEHYDKTAARYDATRWPIGAKIITGYPAQGRTPLAEATLPEAHLAEHDATPPQIGQIMVL